MSFLTVRSVCITDSCISCQSNYSSCIKINGDNRDSCDISDNTTAVKVTTETEIVMIVEESNLEILKT